MVKKILEGDGWLVFRFAGSKPLDLVAFRNGKIMLVECKLSGVDTEAIEKAHRYASLTGLPVMIFFIENGALKSLMVNPVERKGWANSVQMLHEFADYILNKTGLESLCFEDWDKLIWDFLYEGADTKC
ncbi:MAG: hypothetical protein OH337_04025 [Candidatus Parvarchaeota archaeon]|nr:hypothetical protein [Candidatus Haiyanarchaeum thermophilum]